MDEDDDDEDSVKPPQDPVKRIQTGKDVFRAGGRGTGAAKVFEGWLNKKPPNAMIARERRRWFVLHEDGDLKCARLHRSSVPAESCTPPEHTPHL